MAERDYKKYAGKDPNPLHEEFAAWITEKTGEAVDLRSVYLATVLRMAYQASPENKARNEARAEAKAALQAAKAEAKAAKAEAAKEQAAAAKAKKADAAAAPAKKAAATPNKKTAAAQAKAAVTKTTEQTEDAIANDPPF